MQQKVFHVFLGRFSPIHKGHQMIINKMIEKFGIENCLIIIGSSTSLNKRTPFTYKIRKKMINILYPKIKIIGVSDINPELEFYNIKNLENWLDQLETLQKKLKREFIFYGGSVKDVKFLQKRFNAVVMVNRHKDGLGISATKIRSGLLKKEHNYLHNLLAEKIISLAIKEFNMF
jgi:cytidyltransferase-like protein